MTRRIAVGFEGPRAGRVELSLVDFLLAGSSFGICREAHLWPPLATFNEFLAYGVDDTDDGGGMVWSPFELAAAEYEEVVAEVDSESRFDGLACEDGDWRNWFLAAVKRLRG